MGALSGIGRELPGVLEGATDEAIFVELRGSIWQAVNDWFFGVNSVLYPWEDPADANKLTSWVLSADDAMVMQINVLTDQRRVEVEAASGTVDGTSNQRELMTIPESATWGVAHALCEIYGGPKFLTGGTTDEGMTVIKPQHGIGLRAQEDVKRRAVLFWHDIAFGLPQSINVGVWSSFPDGTGFTNRQGNLAMDLGESYTPSAASVTKDDDAGLVFTGTSPSNWSTPDHSSLDINGDFTVKVDLSASDWTPGVFTSIFSKFRSTDSQRSYRARITTSGAWEVITSATGSSTTKTWTMDSTGAAVLAALGNGARYCVAIDFDFDNGAGGANCTYWGAPTWNGPWTQLGATITVAGAMTIFAGSANFELAAVNDGTVDRLAGRIHQFQLRPTRWEADQNYVIPPVVDVRPGEQTNAVTSFTDRVGKVWTKGTNASLENTQVGSGTATIGAHSLRVGDRVNLSLGEEHVPTDMQRVSNVVSGTLPGGHTLSTGNLVRVFFSSDSSFDGLFACTVSGNTISWVDAGTDASGVTSVIWDSTYDTQTALITSVTATTVTYEHDRPTRASIPVTVNSRVTREFPYMLEAAVAGNIARCRAWGRHQERPDWLHQTRALVVDLDKVDTNYTATLRERTSNVATLTIGTHAIMVGQRITVTSVSDSSFNVTKLAVTAITATTISYPSTGSDVGSTASGGNVLEIGTGTSTNIRDNPTPVGSGRIAFIDSHVGTHNLSKVSYGPFYGDNQLDSAVVLLVPAELSLSAVSSAGTTTVTPATVAVTVSVPAVGVNVSAGPAAVAGIATIPAVGVNVVAAPAAVAAVVAVPQPAVNATVGPSVVAATAALAQASIGVAASPATIATTVTLPQATPVTDADYPVIEYADFEANVTSDSASWQCGMPTNITAGNLLILFVCTDGVVTTTWESGWVEILDQSNSDNGLHIAYRIADGTEGSTTAVTLSAAEQGVAMSMRISNWHGTTPPAVASTTGDSATPDAPSLNPADWDVEDTLWIAAASWDGTPTWSSDPSGYGLGSVHLTSGGSTGAGGAIAAHTGTVATENPPTFSISGSEQWVTATVAVRPGATGGATVTPAAIAVTTSMPAVSVNAAAGPNTAAATTAVPSVSVNVAAGPSVVAATIAVPQSALNVAASPAAVPTVVAMPQAIPDARTDVAPVTIATAATIPTATVSVAASPSTVVVVAAVPAPSLSVSATTTAATISVAATVPQPSPSVGASPATIAAATTVPQPAINVAAGPAAAPATTTVPRPGVNVTVGATLAAADVSVPQATPQTAGNATVSPATVAVAASAPAASVNVAAGPASVAASVASPPASVTAAAGPAVCASTVAVPQAATDAHTVIQPATAAAAVNVPTAAVSVAASPSSVATAAAIGQATPQVGGDATISPVTVAVVANVPAAGVNVATSPGAVAASVTVPGSSVSVAAQAGTVTVPITVVPPSVNVTASPATVATAVSVPQAAVGVAATIAPAVTAAQVGIPQQSVGVAAGPAVVGVTVGIPTPVAGVLASVGPIHSTFREQAQPTYREPAQPTYREPTYASAFREGT